MYSFSRDLEMFTFKRGFCYKQLPLFQVLLNIKSCKKKIARDRLFVSLISVFIQVSALASTFILYFFQQDPKHFPLQTGSVYTVFTVLSFTGSRLMNSRVPNEMKDNLCVMKHQDIWLCGPDLRIPVSRDTRQHLFQHILGV